MSIDPASRAAAHRPRLLVLAVATALMVSLLGGAAVAQSSPGPSTPPSSSASSSVADAPIPLSSLAELTSLDAVVTITADGTMDGKQTSGELTATLVSNDQQESRIDVTGSLLGPVAAQVGGKLVGLFRPKAVSVYTVAEGTYIVVSGLTDLCVEANDSIATEALAQLSPQNLMEALTSSDVARGRFVGDEERDGVSVGHYVIDGARFLAAAQTSTSDPAVQGFAEALTGASDADLYVSAATGYPVAYRGDFSGAYEPLALDGDFAIDIELTGVNTDTPVTLPAACDRPIAL